ncbi:MAG: serine hydrolase domain-containing protein [Bacteroidota bacterium]
MCTQAFIRTAFIGFSLCLFVNAPLQAQALPDNAQSTGKLSTTGVAELDTYFEEFVAAQKIPGVTYAIAHHGKIEVMRSIGYQDIENQTPVTDSTIYRIASMTKIVTSVAVLQLIESGKIALDDPISRYIPELSNQRVLVDVEKPDGPTEPATQAMTVKQLLMHTSGLGMTGGNGINGQYGRIMGNPSLSLQQQMEAIGELPLLYQPGTQWRYSMATAALGYLVEVVSEMPFAIYLQQHIFAPLGMRDTGFYVDASRQSRVISVYRASEGNSIQRTRHGLMQRETVPPNAPNGAGGLFSTVPDYLRFAQMLLNGGTLEGVEILKAETVDLMTRDHLPDTITLPERFGRNYGLAGYGFGLGVRVRTDVQRSNLPGNAGEYGWGGLFETYILIDPSASLVALYMTQVRPSSFYPLRRDFTRLVYGTLTE